MIFFLVSILIFFSLISFQLVNQNENINKIENYTYWILVIIISFFIGLNGSNDEYTKMFFSTPYLSQIFIDGLTVLKTNYSVNSYGYEKEILFLLIISFLKSLQLGPQLIYIFFGTIPFLINAYFISKFTKFIFLALLIYVSHHLIFRELSGIRLATASSLILPAIYFLEKKKYYYAFFICILSAQIHNVAYLSFIIFLAKFHIRNQIYIISFVLLLILSLFGVFSFFIDIIVGLNLLPPRVEAYYISERYRDYYTYSIPLPLSGKLIQQIIIVFIIIYFISKSSKVASIPYFNILKNTYFFSTFLFICLQSFPIVGVRINANFMAIESILISFILYFVINKKITSLVLGLFLLFLCFINYIYLSRIDDYRFIVDTMCIWNQEVGCKPYSERWSKIQ